MKPIASFHTRSLTLAAVMFLIRYMYRFCMPGPLARFISQAHTQGKPLE